MTLIDDFKHGDLLYGFREDLEKYSSEIEDKVKDLKYFTQSHINKELSEPKSEHLVNLKSPQKKPEVRRYGTILQPQDNTIYKDANRPTSFFTFLAINYSKHNLIEVTPQCTFFKRLCKQGIQYANQSNLKIHFLLDTIHDQEGRQESIVKKNADTRCTDCRLDSVTASELRSIYRNWDNLKDTVVFWYHNKKVQPPWEDPEHSELWIMYEPQSRKAKNK